jgi:gluconate 2-dehydrogenase gamma chain
MTEEQDSFTITRRTVIASATFVPLAALTASAQAPSTALTPAQLNTLEAIIDRIVPQDELGPGAVECGAATYIDRALAGALAAEKGAFVEGLAGVDALARSTYNAAFADLMPEMRDSLLTSIEERPFFGRVRRLTLEGMFSDPYYGGNRNFAGWDLIRYPGPRLAVGPEDQKMSTPPRPYRRSAYGTASKRA